MAIKKFNTTEKKTNKRSVIYHMEEECGRFGKKGDVRLTYGRYNENAEKYYFQTWKKNPNGEGEIPVKCIGFTGEELEELYNVLKAMVEDEDNNEGNNEDNEDNEDEEEGGDESDSSLTEPKIITEHEALLEALDHRDTGFAGGKLNLIHIFDTTGWGEKKVTKEQMDDRLAKIIKAFGTGGYGRPSHGYGIDDIWHDPKGYVLNWNDSEGKHEKKFTWRKVEKALRELIEKWRTELDVAA